MVVHRVPGVDKSELWTNNYVTTDVDASLALWPLSAVSAVTERPTRPSRPARGTTSSRSGPSGGIRPRQLLWVPSLQRDGGKP